MPSKELTPTQLKIYRLIEEKDRKAAELIKILGCCKDTVHRNIPVLANNGLIYLHGRGRSCYYSIKPKPGGTFPLKTRDIPKPLPDFPPQVLLMMGYTDIKPKGGYIVKGEW